MQRPARDGFRVADASAVFLLLAMVIAIVVTTIDPVMSFIRGDWPGFNFPLYSYMGERLRELDIPGWNAYQFSGAPFVGDPGSGWMYVPAMIIYSLFPPERATTVYLAMHVALAAVAMYSLARLLGANICGGLVAAASFAFAWVVPASMNMVIFFPPMIMLVIALLGVEIDAAASSWNRRLVGWVISGVATSQILAIWLGQVAYYALLVIAAWIVYRRMLFPDTARPLRARVAQTALSGAVILGFGLAFAAPALLPVLDTVSRSNLAGGAYNVASSWADAKIGYSPARILSEGAGGYAGMIWWYFGAVAVSLAVMSPVVARSWRPMPFFAAVSVGSVILALDRATPLHALAYALLPRFANLHQHSPERILLIAVPATALLAAGAVTFLPCWCGPRALLAAAALSPGVLAATLRFSVPGGAALLAPEATTLVIATSMLATAVAVAPRRTLWHAAMLGLVVLALWDPWGRLVLFGFADESKLERSLEQSLGESPGQFLYANGAAAFLTRQNARSPARYFGFDPFLLDDPERVEVEAPDFGYRSIKRVRAGEGVDPLLVLNWGTWFHIDDVQGYDPVQVQRYVEFIDAMNGHRQEYHERDVYPGGLDSPLLDLLGARYLLVRANVPITSDIAPLLTTFPTVYEDAEVRILENSRSFPRAWLVHDARRVGAGDALPILASGAIDPHKTALLEVSLPNLSPAVATADTAVYRRATPDRIEIAVNASASALLMLSEVWSPGWHAAIDGAPTSVYLADHVLQAVAVPEGEHVVTLMYDPPYLRLGFAAAAIAALLVMILAMVFRFHRRHVHG